MEDAASAWNIGSMERERVDGLLELSEATEDELVEAAMENRRR